MGLSFSWESSCRGLWTAGGFRKVFFQHFSSLIDQLRLGVCEIDAKPAAVSNAASQARDKIRFGVAPLDSGTLRFLQAFALFRP
jgi:hypothetical protein